MNNGNPLQSYFACRERICIFDFSETSCTIKVVSRSNVEAFLTIAMRGNVVKSAVKTEVSNEKSLFCLSNYLEFIKRFIEL